jgi:hypothetical protein
MVDTDPPRRTPTIVWWMLGLILVVAFVAVVMMLRGHPVVAPAVGPPAGAPATAD